MATVRLGKYAGRRGRVLRVIEVADPAYNVIVVNIPPGEVAFAPVHLMSDYEVQKWGPPATA